MRKVRNYKCCLNTSKLITGDLALFHSLPASLLRSECLHVARFLPNTYTFLCAARSTIKMRFSILVTLLTLSASAVFAAPTSSDDWNKKKSDCEKDGRITRST